MGVLIEHVTREIGCVRAWIGNVKSLDWVCRGNCTGECSMKLCQQTVSAFAWFESE